MKASNIFQLARRAFTVYSGTMIRAARLEVFGRDCGETILLDAATATEARAGRAQAARPGGGG